MRREISRGFNVRMTSLPVREISKNTFSIIYGSLGGVKKLFKRSWYERNELNNATPNGYKNEILIFIASASHQN